jgi:hypothetical protein
MRVVERLAERGEVVAGDAGRLVDPDRWVHP